MHLHPIQHKILKCLKEQESLGGMGEIELAKNLELNQIVINEHLKSLINHDFVMGFSEPNMEGIDYYLMVQLKNKGYIYLENPNNLETNDFFYTTNNLTETMEENFKLILDLINTTDFRGDDEIAENIDIELDEVRFYLKEMSGKQLIELHKIIFFESDPYECQVSEITPKGKMFLKGKININDNDQLETQRNIYVNDSNYFESMNGSNNQFNSGSGDNVGQDKNITNVYNSQDLSQAAVDIQELLEQLDKTYNTNTTTGKMTIATQAIEQIDNDANLTQKIISAVKSGSISALESLIDHPAASFFIAALEDWQQTRK